MHKTTKRCRATWCQLNYWTIYTWAIDIYGTPVQSMDVMYASTYRSCSLVDSGTALAEAMGISDPCCLACWPVEFVTLLYFFKQRVQCMSWHCFQNSIFLNPMWKNSDHWGPRTCGNVSDSCFLVPQSKLHQLCNVTTVSCAIRSLCHENVWKSKFAKSSTFRAVCVLTVTIMNSD